MKIYPLIFILWVLLSLPKVLTAQPTYESTNYAIISNLVTQMTTSSIDGSNNNNNKLTAGTLIVYQTNEGRLGKLQILTYGYNIQLRAVTYQPSGKIYKQTPSLTIRGTWLCDLDQLVESSSGGDFWWEQLNKTIRYLVPWNKARFYVVPPAPQQTLKGFSDMHTHLMSHLSMGGKVMYGAPDGDMATALANCNPHHGGPGIFNMGGDFIRAEIVNKLDERYIYRKENKLHMDHPHEGYPHFKYWPHWSSATHQQMWWEWIKRAHEGGLNVMVALAVHNTLINQAAAGIGDRVWDDKASVELQLLEMRRFVARHFDFMEIAKTPADLRRIVMEGKLAVILGVETEDLGNLSRRRYFGQEAITIDKVKAEIQRLYDQFDVRYILPIHFSNNIFGGTALSRNLFLLSSKYYANIYPFPLESCGEGIGYKLEKEHFAFPSADALRSRNLGWVIDNQPTYPTPATGCGQRNITGLSYLGRAAIKEMMRLGIMIDIDHMSQQAVTDIFNLTSDSLSYPLNSGHNGPRNTGKTTPADNENSRTEDQYRGILERGGMIGLGHGGTATGFVNSFRNVSRLADGKNVAIGTDVNGFYALAAPDSAALVTYDSSFPNYQSPAGRPWDINKEGFAHYGLFPDFIKSWLSAGMTNKEQEAFHSTAEDFARMWEKCVSRSKEIFADQPDTRTVNVDPMISLCPNTHVSGDREFDGHGPRVRANVILRISTSGNRVEAVINFSARETQNDWSEVRGSWIRTIYTAPLSRRIQSITSPTRTSINQVLVGGGGNEIFRGCDGDVHTLRPGGPVARMFVVGDTGGDDISSDGNCNCDTRINRIEFNPVTVTLTPASASRKSFAPLAGITNEKINKTAGSYLDQNNPNPFDQHTTINYQVISPVKQVTLKIINMAGITVKQFANLPTGKHEISLEGNSLPPGVYVYTLNLDGQQVAARKMVLVK
ncbi:membrane dipeptidase [Adhaeribacter radiodurans]|uniref:Membrane dipeptidase n=1 Tax=Adhaeribacter radiodurans TaxID=2745197 RepID=A0A7L7L8M7_9BACT|nr:membrane dipeptidase [Adhaeribacter radiodurans]QMU29093.1 membrane dipeptidase [Adhaeribacter radiodurans]